MIILWQDENVRLYLQSMQFRSSSRSDRVDYHLLKRLRPTTLRKMSWECNIAYNHRRAF